MQAARHSEIPFGHYCYGYVPTPGFGFSKLDDLYQYAATLSESGWTKIRSQRQQVRYCPHWQFLKGGRVECTHLGIRTALIGRENEARAYYRSHPDEEAETPKAFLLGDAIKECNLNTGGTDFTIPH